MRLVGIATFSVVVETSFKRITCEFSGASCLPGPTTTGGGDRSSRSSLSSCHPDVPGAIVGVFVPRYETDSTFASTSLQRNETAIAFASDERPFLGISTLQRCCRFQWSAQHGLQRCWWFQWGAQRGVQRCWWFQWSAQCGVQRCWWFQSCPFFAGEPLKALCRASFFAGEPLEALCWASFFAEVPRMSH